MTAPSASTDSSPSLAAPAPGAVLAEAFAFAITAHRRGALDTAAELYAAILGADPEHFDALHMGGVLAQQQGELDLAERLIACALRVQPESAEAHNNLGAVYQASGRDALAEAQFALALTLNPAYGAALMNLGLNHERRGDRPAAIAYYHRALEAGVATPGLLTNLGSALSAQDKDAEAIAAFTEALRHDECNRPALLGLAGAALNLGRFDAAERAFTRVVAIDPDNTAGWIGLGMTALERTRYEDAIRCFDRVLGTVPDHAQARWNRALACLASGRLGEGWRDFGWRWHSHGFDSVRRPFRAPAWDGTTLAGQTILVWREQGLGDEILFSSMLPDLERMAARVIVECEPRLTPLLRRSFPAIECVAAGHPPHFRTADAGIDCHAPIGDLARLLRPSLERFPRKRAYLRADPQRVEYWRGRLAASSSAPAIGICWRSSNRRGLRALACTELEQWGPILRTRGVRFVNLQYDPCDQDIARAAELFGIDILTFPDLDMHDDIDETAALIAALDLVISAPTTVSLLAAALGTTTWQLTCGPDWQALGQSDSPWQGALRRFYRTQDEHWSRAIDSVANALDAWRRNEIAVQ